jgi:hypothetical protein
MSGKGLWLITPQCTEAMAVRWKRRAQEKAAVAEVARGEAEAEAEAEAKAAADTDNEAGQGNETY